MEAEEENLTEEKRLSLGQEVSKYQIHVFVQDCNFLLFFAMKGIQHIYIYVHCGLLPGVQLAGGRDFSNKYCS